MKYEYEKRVYPLKYKDYEAVLSDHAVTRLKERFNICRPKEIREYLEVASQDLVMAREVEGIWEEYKLSEKRHCYRSLVSFDMSSVFVCNDNYTTVITILPLKKREEFNKE